MPIHDFLIYTVQTSICIMLSIILLMCQYTCTLKMVTMFDAGAYCHFFEFKGRSDSTDCHH